MCAFALSLLSLSSAHAAFQESAAAAGLNAGHPVSGVDQPSNGAACAVDLNGDGLTDLILGRTGKSCQVFINKGDGTFADEAAVRGLDTVTDIAGIAAGDFSNRGVRDIVMVPVRGERYYLFINDGTGHFTERAVERGVDMTVTTPPSSGPGYRSDRL